MSALNVEERYRPDIDGLRAVAILGVVAYHVGLPGVTGGFAGVDVFFVLSGYLITQLLARELADTGTVSISKFYARRMRRLLPALALVLLASVALSWVLLPPGGEREELAQSALASLSFVANHFFKADLGGYFAGAAERKPLLHLWSLSVEEQFYVVWPLVLVAIARLTAARTRLAWMRWSIGTLTIGSFILSAWLMPRDPIAGFYLAAPRAWELGVGAFLALMPARLRSGHPRLGRVAAAIGALLVAGSFTLLEYSTRFPGPAAVPAVLGTALLIWGNAQDPATLLCRILVSRVMISIGVTSYGWYLWHWPLLAYLREATLMQAGVASSAVAALIAYVLAALSLKYVETPIRRGNALARAPTAGVLRYGLATLASMALVAGATWAWAANAPRSERSRLAAKVDDDTPERANDHCMLQIAAWKGSLSAAKCHFGARGPGTDLVLWGDSHAFALAPLLLAPQQQGSPTFEQLTMASCLPLVHQTSPLWNFGRNCWEFNELALREIVRLKREEGLKGVIIAGWWSRLWNPVVPRDVSAAKPRGIRDAWRAWQNRSVTGSLRPAGQMLASDLAATFEALQDAGLKVWIFMDPPEFPRPLPSCAYFEFSNLPSCGISRADYDAQAGEIKSIIERVARRFPAVHTFDPAPFLCDSNRCPAFIGDRPIVWDTHHMSASTARSLAPLVRSDIRWLQGSDASRSVASTESD